MGRQKGSSWEAFWDLSWVKKVRKSDAKKGLVLEGLGGGVGAIVVRSLGAGSDKGETGWHLPPSLNSVHVPLVRWSCGSFVAFCC